MKTTMTVSMTMVNMVGMHSHHDRDNTRKRHHGGARFSVCKHVENVGRVLTAVGICIRVSATVNVVTMLTNAVGQ